MAKRKYYLVLDTETANSIDDPLVFDIGYQVADKKGRVYDEGSFLIRDIFVVEKLLMKKSYYSHKIPTYWNDQKKGIHKIVTWNTARKKLNEIVEKYDIDSIMAYNVRFDYRSIHKTQRFLTNSRWRFFFNRKMKWYCIWQMAKDTVCKQKGYQQFAQENNLFTPTGKIKTSAEVVYQYFLMNPKYKEEHTGLEDVKIETTIMAWCFRQKKKMRHLVYG